jgi:hypothetical protein
MMSGRVQVLTKSGDVLLLRQLSDGEQRLFSILVDIARCLTLETPDGVLLKQTPAVVIIDEIDLHLVPPALRRLPRVVAADVFDLGTIRADAGAIFH